MRVIVTAILLCMLLGACGSKGGLYMPPKMDKAADIPASSAQQSNNKQN
jgi:predicted small lipoprotein YifL